MSDLNPFILTPWLLEKGTQILYLTKTWFLLGGPNVMIVASGTITVS